MIDALALAIREGFALVITSTLPLFVAALVAALLVGLLGGALGIRDAVFGHVVRTLMVVLTLGLVIEAVALGTIDFAARTWTLGEDDAAKAEP
jgi:type III secretory pathway component EscS